jgi:radical SAM protein with 4Fe4S-binding SPASM domain
MASMSNKRSALEEDMTPADLRNLLSLEFDLLCFEDLSEMSADPHQLHRVMAKTRRDIFEQKERLVFYSNQTPPVSLIKHLKRTCDFFDISVSFVLLVCGCDLSQEIEKYCDVGDVFDSRVIEVSGGTLQQGYENPNTICPLPWMHLTIDNQGNISPCCINLENLGSIVTDDIESVFQGESLEKLRRSLESGVRHPSCENCWIVEDAGGTSQRHEMLKWYRDKFFGHIIDQPGIKSLDLKAGNICNFKCRSCNENASSLIAAESLMNSTDPDEKFRIKTLQKNGRWFEFDVQNPESKILKILPEVDQIDFYGGEPFLSPQLEVVIDNLISLGQAHQVRLHFNTNGSIFPEKLIDRLQRFRQIDIGISIDDVGERFEIARGGNWHTVSHNIRMFQHLDHKIFNTHIFVTVSVLNVYYLHELFSWAKQHDLRILLNFVNTPEYLAIENLTSRARSRVLEFYKNHADPNLQVIYNKVLAAADSDGKEFVERMRYLDQIRNQDMRKTHEKIATDMGYV